MADDSERPEYAPEPVAAHQRRPRAGADDHADHGHTVIDQRDEGRPHRHPAHEVLGAVDRVDHPAAGAVAGRVELLALDGVARPGPLELGPDVLLGGAVGVGHRREVRLALDDEVLGAEPGDRHPLHRVGEDVGQAEVVVVVRRGRGHETTT